ncbi:glutamate--tRNA ligase [bacterium]|nr:glutamate--tRNA ligase [bacterium]
MMSVRVRFAPSPSGYLHVGGARTALFNYLFAKRHKGQFILRVEDTDRERSSQESIAAILEGLDWLGIHADEGPFFQSERDEIYAQYLQRLIETGAVYKCFLSKEELDARREALKQAGKTPKYDGREEQLKNQDQDKPFVWRFKVPEGETVIDDQVKGKTTYQNKELEDFVVARTDGTCTYNFVNVVDDLDMNITHVIRGDDHLNNTAKQILLYKALGEALPVFAHVPLILGQDKKRLSKRHGATAVQMYRDMGYLPHAMVNFLVRLGWSYEDKEIFSAQDLEDLFSLDNIGKSAGIFNEEKLIWLNQHYIKEADQSVLQEQVDYFIGIPDERKNTAKGFATLNALRDRAKTTKELAELARFYFHDDLVFFEGVKEKFITPESVKIMAVFREKLEKIETCDHDHIKSIFDETLKELDIKFKFLGQPLRIALTGSPYSPGIMEIVEILGKDRSLQRLKAVGA